MRSAYTQAFSGENACVHTEHIILRNISIPQDNGYHFGSEMALKLLKRSILDLAHPAVEGGDVRSNGVQIHTLGAEDDGVLALIYGNLNSPVNDDIKALLVQGLSVALIEGAAGLQNEVVELVVSDIIHVVGAAGFLRIVAGEIDLIHVGIHAGTPGGAPHRNLIGGDAVPQVGGVGQILYHKIDTDRLESVGSKGNKHEGRMVA